MATVEEQLNTFQKSGQRPIAGQSLTNDPENPMPFEKPPRFTDVHEATEYLWMKIINEKTYVSLMGVLDDGIPVMDVTQLLLRAGFQEGLWNPDLMILLIEPTAYMLIALAEPLEINLVIYEGELEDEDDEERILGVSYEEEKIRKMMEASEINKVPEGIITQEMQDALAEANLPDALGEGVEEQVEEEEVSPEETALAAEETAAPPQESLMARPQEQG